MAAAEMLRQHKADLGSERCGWRSGKKMLNWKAIEERLQIAD